jgi:hypothetical protein
MSMMWLAGTSQLWRRAEWAREISSLTGENVSLLQMFDLAANITNTNPTQIPFTSLVA